MTTALLQEKATSYDRAITKACEALALPVPPRSKKIHAGYWLIESLSERGKAYEVHLGSGMELEGASCNCKASQHESCVHRAIAYLKLQNHLEGWVR